MRRICEKKYQKEFLKTVYTDKVEGGKRLLKAYQDEVRRSVIDRLKRLIMTVERGISEPNLVDGNSIDLKECCGLEDFESVYKVLNMDVYEFLKGLGDDIKFRVNINQICGAELDELKNVPHDERYKYYVVEYEGEKEWCYIQRDEDMGCKYVGILSVKFDRKEKAGILPFPCETVHIETDDGVILDNFIVRYYDTPPIDDCLEEARWCMGDYDF